ncbi:hypothetical protein CU663_21660, partial [Pseudomonas syringae pv. actinidifoliorum]|nr:hypothetical protein [Pseudomonas syringae pv. actinidifoliorum]
TDWQRQTADSATCAARLCRSVQVSSAATWLKATLLPHFEAREANYPRVCDHKPGTGSAASAGR